jgi:hypothetical protein
VVGDQNLTPISHTGFVSDPPFARAVKGPQAASKKTEVKTKAKTRILAFQYLSDIAIF